MDVKIKVDTAVFEKAQALLSPSQIAGAMRMAINEGLTKGRTEVRRGIQETYNIKTARLNNEKTGLKITKAYGLHLTGDISASHKPIPIKEADPRFKGVTIATKVSFGKGKAKKGGSIKRSTSTISVEVIKGQRKTIDSAFALGRVGNVKSGMQSSTTAIFARGQRGKPGFVFGKSRMPIDVISTVSPGTAATNERSVEKYSDAVNSYAEKRFIYHIERLIKKVEEIPTQTPS